jgi:hypothetical protein
MSSVHPAYDPVAKAWFVEGTQYEARTLRDLQAKLQPGTKIVGYFPNGFQGEVVVHDIVARMPINNLDRPTVFAPKLAVDAEKRATPRKTSLPTVRPAGGYVPRGKDSREGTNAYQRARYRDKFVPAAREITDEDRAVIRRMVIEEGKSFGACANFLGLTRNQVGGYASREKKRMKRTDCALSWRSVRAVARGGTHGRYSE